ncbi:MAG TPA: C45 family autoproteolytic acyltransferase/hydrolase [Polyangia bacterium]|nr:C45 family autoproteolytic acyltransferase/hydrolase [Polyangia bacterium]
MASSSSLVLGSRRAPGRRWLRRLTVGSAVTLVVLVVGYLIFLRMTRIDPPPVADDVRAAAEHPLEARGPRAYVGPSWMSREHGVWEIHLEGEPYALGYAQARLGSRLLLEQEDFMFAEMARYVPSGVKLFLIRAGVRLRYRHLNDFLPPDRRLEIAGLAAGSIDRHADFLPTYHRIMFYHALHDITQGLEHSPMLGCTAFAAAGAATVGGHLIIGRNFDFEGPEIFDREKAVLFFKPKGKIAFASVAWTGMSGVVTGINAEGIYISINAARTDDKGKDGMPVEILVREALESARSIDDVVQLVKKTPVMVPDFYLVADGKTGESAVIERSPTRTEVRRSAPGRGDVTLLTNHALSPAFAGDAENDRLKRYLTSGARYRRLDELIKKWRGQIDPRKALEILRDKRGAGGEALGLGNRNTLDAIIATHSVIVDASAMILWVSQGPHLLGKMRAFDLKRELGGEERPAPVDLPEDAIAETQEYADYREAAASLKSAERFQRERDWERAVEEARRAEALEEKMPEAHRLLGDLYVKRGDSGAARREYQRFLELSPPYLKDVEEVKGILGTL